MRFSVPVDSITPAFAAALSAAARKSTKPVLMHVKCEAADDGTLTLHGFNGECGVVATVVGATVDVAGAAVLQGVKLLDVLKLNRGDTVSIEVGEKSAVVRTKKSKHELAVFPAEEFPDVRHLIEQTHPVAEIAANSLLSAVRRGDFAATERQDDSRFDPRGVLLHCDGPLVRLASMQPGLAAISHAALNRSHVAEAVAIVHFSSLRLLASVLPDGGEPVELRYVPGSPCGGVAFATPVVAFFTRTLAISPVPVEKIDPKVKGGEPMAEWSNAEPLFDGTEEASINTDLTSQRVQFTIQSGGGVAATVAEGGRSEVEFEVPEFSGTAFNISLHGLSLKTVIRSLSKERGRVRCQAYKVGAGGFQRLIFRHGDDQAGGLAAMMEMSTN